MTYNSECYLQRSLIHTCLFSAGYVRCGKMTCTCVLYYMHNFVIFTLFHFGSTHVIVLVCLSFPLNPLVEIKITYTDVNSENC